MDPNLKFSCSYKPAGTNQSSSTSCAPAVFSAFFLIFFITVSVIRREWFMLMLTLLFSVVFIWSLWSSSMDQYIHVTMTALQVVRSDGKILEEYALKDIWGVNMPDRDTLNFMVRSDESGTSSEVTLRLVADIDGLVAAIAKWGHVQSAAPHMIPEVPVLPQPKPQPILPRVMREDEADELHAAQHLLNQGMISPKQYSEMLVPPVPDRAPAQSADINAMNAADYLQRQEMLAQQFGTMPEISTDEEEKNQNGRAGLV